VGERTETEAKKYKGKKSSKVNVEAGGGENERSGWTEQKGRRMRYRAEVCGWQCDRRVEKWKIMCGWWVWLGTREKIVSQWLECRKKEVSGWQENREKEVNGWLGNRENGVSG
jgi:hypothetical protein